LYFLSLQLETNWLDHLDDVVTKEEGLQLLRETNELHQIQAKEDTEEELSLIPRLDISDLNATMYQLPIKVDEDIFDSGLTLLEHTIPNSNGVAYFDFVIDISNIDFDDIVLLPLFCQMLMRGGTDQKTDVQFQREIDTSTGGMTVYPIIDEVLETDGNDGYIVPDGKHLVSKVAVRTSCVANTGCLAVFTLIRQLLFNSKVDNHGRAIEVLEKMIDDMEDDIQVNGHVYTTQRINSRYSLPGFFAEQWKGVTQLFNLRRSLAQARADFPVLGNRMVLMHDAMKRGNRNGMLLSVTGDHQAIKDISASIEIFVKDLLPPSAQVSKFPDFGKAEHPWVTKGLHRMEEELKVTSANEAFIVPTRINHVGRGGVLYDQGERITGSDAVGLHLLSGYYLYDKVRFSLGASQAWAVLDADSGSVIYQSENDPNIAPTLDAYDAGVTWLFKQVDGRDTLSAEGRGAVVGMIGVIDGSEDQPSQVGFDSLLQYLRQDKPEYRQKWRDEVMGATPQHIKAMAERLGAWAQESIVVVTDELHLNRALDAGLNFTTCSYSGQACNVP
jgi:Zn-dependent M16 (insulinase) family peptidase